MRCAEGLLRERADVIALQEVNQSCTAPRAAADPRFLAVPAAQASVGLRRDNYALALARMLAERQLPYFWCWLPMKRGYRCYDEGLACFCRRPIVGVRAFPISRTHAYDDWRTRWALCVQPQGSGAWFCNLHTGWWQDSEEPFAAQWQEFLRRRPMGGTVWLMGDLNNSPDRRGEGYDRIAADGFYDCYALAEQTEGEATVRGRIDGWRTANGAGQGLRIDQIWCSRAVTVRRVRTLWDGVEEPPVSDHAGVLAEIGSEASDDAEGAERSDDSTEGRWYDDK